MNKNPKTEPKERANETPNPTPGKTPRQAKRYDTEFKRAAVENWIQTGKPGTQIAAELGISYPSLKEWKARYSGPVIPERDTLEAENRALRRELARVSEQRDILKKTLHIFTEPSSNATKPSKP